ncbi:MAG TPA: response regulator transcription factor [Candidatus Binatia bacterium]|nr:response regulator transcription factor [Candidatus Binatia bacterium]
MTTYEHHIRKTILIIEDDPKTAKALAVRLEAAGYDVLTAADGVQGVRLALDHRPDLIISDIWLPAGIGLSVAQRLKRAGLGNIPVVFMTASKLPGLKEAAMQLGAAAYFEKPYDPEALLRTITEIIDRTANHPSAHAQKQGIAV